jgi:hypothetical protein
MLVGIDVQLGGGGCPLVVGWLVDGVRCVLKCIFLDDGWGGGGVRRLLLMLGLGG